MSNGDPGFDSYETPMDDELAATMKSVLDEPEMAMRAPGEGAETPFTFLVTPPSPASANAWDDVFGLATVLVCGRSCCRRKHTIQI